MVALIYLLDSNVLSEPAKPQPDLRLMEAFERHREASCTAAPVLHELHYGMEKLPRSKLKGHLDFYLRTLRDSGIPVLSYDADAALWHARERARLIAEGKTPSFEDGQIAAVAAVNDLVLVTRNTRDFAGFSGLRLEDWFES